MSAFAAIALLAPGHRAVGVHWPERVVEWIHSDGTVALLPAGQRPDGDAIARSRPLNAARIEIRTGAIEYGYLVSIRREPGRPGARPERPPDAAVWQPRSGRCELAVAPPARSPRWLSCAAVRSVIRPNRMNFAQRLGFALEQPVARLASFGIPVP